MHNAKIMVVDDELEIAQLMRDYLEEEQFQVIISTDGREAVHLFREQEPQLIILDVMLPSLSGMEVCRIIRAESAVPIIMLSARKSDIDKIIALGLGADDYVIKPFSPREVVARVKAQLRRHHLLSAPAPAAGLLKFGELEIDPQAYIVKLNGKPVDFSAKEFEVLLLFARHPHQVLTREQIFDRVWGFQAHGDLNTVTVHIQRIRQKIEENAAKPRFIVTVRGVGYRFDGGTR